MGSERETVAQGVRQQEVAALLSRIDGLPQMITELRELTREAHEVQRDLAATIKAGREFLATELPGGLEARFATEVAAGVEAHRAAVAALVGQAQASVLAEFDAMMARLLGTSTGQPLEQTLALYLGRVRSMAPPATQDGQP